MTSSRVMFVSVFFRFRLDGFVIDSTSDTRVGFNTQHGRGGGTILEKMITN